MTDGDGSARWFHPLERTTLTPGPDFTVVMTTNVERLSDIPAALRDRFPVAIRIDRPHPVAVRSLSSDLQGPALQGSLGPEGRRVSLRSFQAFDRLRRHLGADRAARLVVGAESAQDFLDALTISALGV
jgi:MoxR-like ATPase